MKNFVQEGNMVYAPAPGGGILSGQGALIGGMFGVAAVDAAAGVALAWWLKGIYSLPKLAGAAWSVGQIIYWDSVAKQCNSVGPASTTVPVIGVATALAPTYLAAAASADTVV
jgi:predicted RecA/RadA family phage recombinase